MRKRLRIVFVLFITFCFSSFAEQTSLSGQLIDALSGEPVVGAKVELEEHGRTIYTNKEGFYTFGRLQVRHERVIINAEGYAPVRIPVLLLIGPNNIGCKRLTPQKRISPDELKGELITRATLETGYSRELLGATRKSSFSLDNEFVGTGADISFSNREYLFRGELWHRTNVMKNGWKVAGGIGGEIAQEGIVAGTPRQDVHIAFLSEYNINRQHTLSLEIKAATGQQGLSEGALQEAYDLKGIYYNPNWGYQQGNKRNARIEECTDPSVAIEHTWQFSTTSQLKSRLWGEYSARNVTDLTYFNAPNPFPEYYTKLPSSYADEATRDLLTRAWQNGEAGQIDWGELYQRNLSNQTVSPERNTPYVVEKRHREATSGGGKVVFEKSTMAIGADVVYCASKRYKTMYDLLGGSTWKDIEQRPLGDNTVDYLQEQNDLNHPDRNISVGDRFGYDYAINLFSGVLFGGQSWKWKAMQLRYNAGLRYTSVQRIGEMRNGRAQRASEQSFGAGKRHSFVSPDLLVAATFRLNTHLRIKVSIQGQMTAPESESIYTAPHLKDTPLPEVKQEKEIISSVSLHVDYPSFWGYIELFRNDTKDMTQQHIYRDDSLRTQVTATLFNLNEVKQGIRLSVCYKPHREVKINLVGSLYENRYSNNGTGVFSSENQGTLFTDKVYTEGLYLARNPQFSARAEVGYFSPKGWFISLGTTYFDKNYVSFAPMRFTSRIQTELRERYKAASPAEAERYKIAGSQERLPGGVITDASVGALFWLSGGKHRLGVHVSATNLLNDKNIIAGGQQQNSLCIDAINRYPTRYEYAWGTSFSAHLIFYL